VKLDQRKDAESSKRDLKQQLMQSIKQ